MLQIHHSRQLNVPIPIFYIWNDPALGLGVYQVGIWEANACPSSPYEKCLLLLHCVAITRAVFPMSVSAEGMTICSQLAIASSQQLEQLSVCIEQIHIYFLCSSHIYASALSNHPKHKSEQHNQFLVKPLISIASHCIWLVIWQLHKQLIARSSLPPFSLWLLRLQWSIFPPVLIFESQCSHSPFTDHQPLQWLL